jgi:hypothetical protein
MMKRREGGLEEAFSLAYLADLQNAHSITYFSGRRTSSCCYFVSAAETSCMLIKVLLVHQEQVW